MPSLNYRWQDLPGILGLAGFYGLLAKVVLNYFSASGNVTLIWFSGGLGLAVLLQKGLRYWPGIFIGAFAAGLMVDDPLLLSASIAVGNTLESVCAAYLLKRNPRFSVSLSEPQHFLWLALIGIICSVLSAGIGPWSLWLAGFVATEHVAETALHWWMADLFGIIFTTPLLLIWHDWPNNWFRINRLPETLLFVGFTILSGQVLFFDWFVTQLSFTPLPYWTFFFIFWGAMRFGRHGVALALAITAFQALYGAAHHIGRFAYDLEESDLFNFWMYMAILSSCSVILALTVHKNRQVAQGLLESERRLKAIIDTSPTPLALNDDQQNILLLSPAFIKIFGYTLADIPTLADWWLLAYPEPVYRNWVAETWQQRLAAAKLSEDHQFEAMEISVRCKNGETRIALVSAHPLGVSFADTHLVSLHDITELKKSEKAVLESNQLLQTVLETLPIRVFWKDRDSRYLGCNALFASDAGQPSSRDLIGKDDNQLNWREQAAIYQADDRQVIVSGVGKLAYEEPQSTPDGNTIWLRTSKIPLRNSEHETIGVLGIYEDISENKAREDALAQSVSLLMATLEATADGILVVSLQRQIVSYNQRFFDLWQLPNTAVGEDKDDTTLLHLAVKQLKTPTSFSIKSRHSTITRIKKVTT
ncbi:MULTISPECIES: MASE1 domain-containing protein [Methylomonas]|uniref:histidine kinase n=2 Tax=Methylomonas TaxID=416 RepID=A0A126T0T8_9GAMM|nr:MULTISPECIES: MASE1 domain-containing protein [Methylomonas]AMK75695.1 hypothetical protein JT25_004220 [Methylomonas denitrificans]OAH98309.1 hypothetical protein A1342_15055 [Methylomonas methanica]TCV82479.1 PAS domain S-box-containing protein [Methylomonas methanica]